MAKMLDFSVIQLPTEDRDWNHPGPANAEYGWGMSVCDY